MTSPPVRIGKDKFRGFRTQLVTELNNMHRDDFPRLKSLAKLGHDVFQQLSSHSDATAIKWKRLFDAPSDVTHAVVHTRFEADLTFPFGLLCTEKPSSDNYQKIAEKFVGARAVVINSLDRSEDRAHDLDYVSASNPCTLAHAMDGGAPGSDEEAAHLEKLKGVQALRCNDVPELLDLWRSNATGIIHFSGHHYHDEKENEYVLSLTRGEVRALANRGNIPSRKTAQPFVFLNGCASGTMVDGSTDNFIRVLCPHRSAGVLATIHSVDGKQGARFARRFYEHWVNGGFVTDALATAKSSFIFRQRDFSAIAYEFWDTPETLKLYKPASPKTA